jgi:hypothetical protein
LISIKYIEFCSPEKSIGNRLAIPPPKLEFFANETRHISVIKMYLGSIRVEVFTSGVAIVSPKTAILQQYSEMRFTVQLIGNSTTAEIKSEDGIAIIPIRRLKGNQLHEHSKSTKFFELDQKIIDFGLCEVGGVRKINDNR